ncbi:MAG TPA: PilZ domain-containing protein [Smithellaceae bacterium]|nr:PilZ domain-containing protein [Smithellaceae bacterium]HRV25455.1 PilZ domain-containing protein [Smithellaceae bacterium]
MSKDERRTNERLAAKFEISYVHENDYLISFTKNISADGMFIETDKLPAVGSTIRLIFSLGKLKKIESSAKVMWVNKGAVTNDTGMGVKFINMPAKAKEEILKEIKVIAVL